MMYIPVCKSRLSGFPHFGPRQKNKTPSVMDVLRILFVIRFICVVYRGRQGFILNLFSYGRIGLAPGLIERPDFILSLSLFERKEMPLLTTPRLLSFITLFFFFAGLASLSYDENEREQIREEHAIEKRGNAPIPNSFSCVKMKIECTAARHHEEKYYWQQLPCIECVWICDSCIFKKKKRHLRAESFVERIASDI